MYTYLSLIYVDISYEFHYRVVMANFKISGVKGYTGSDIVENH